MTDFAQAELGPKMQACSPMERRFVWAYLQRGGRDATAAAREAGYVDNANGAIRVRAHQLAHRERVIEALQEVAVKHFNGLMLRAVTAVEDILDKPDHPDHIKTALSILSRSGLTERSGLDVQVSGSVTMNHTAAAIEDLRIMRDMGAPREKLLEAFGFSGLPRLEKMLAEVERRQGAGPVIEGEAVRDGG